ncbi:hypothetical protein PFICI_08508 [Pestalotiopsis fici W106-1]|uniref:AB hydrolase-1 domain-containing protein n=1 Tax=Pestalotiopsis fici (strain W106-1 / CGMCC3.15140) TaxID=1229662 RepID=W3WXU1_PESFW|nr:uncharacterized protein PFICI_08508 [Pestalotiopsis fici W106-1]ETS78655.1 hypothetical protein PFICI_08508 [Pestalotiopsis fici W106-1]
MQSFELPLANGGTVTGIHSIPPLSASSAQHRPLIVGLHGGCYDCQYFDATPKYSASRQSSFFGIPFISINRPGYGGTSCVSPIPEGSDFHHASGLMLHRHLLPKLWQEFGVSNQCNSIVLLCHSLGAMSGIVAASLHGQDMQPSYPLSGIITSGMGATQSVSAKSTSPGFKAHGDDYVTFPSWAKDSVMFKPGTVEDEILEQTERLNAKTPLMEVATFKDAWLPVWKEKYAAHVSTPVMFSLVDNDPFFVVTTEEVESCARAFANSARVDGSLMTGAPHCVELSHWSQGWYARCFGFALECAASFGK